MKTNNPLDFFTPKKKNTKGGKGSGNWGHGGLAGVHGGSSPKGGSGGNESVGAPSSSARLPASVTEARMDEIHNSLMEGGFSYQPIGDRFADTGFMVSQRGTEFSMPLKKDHREEIKAFMLDNLKHFEDDEHKYTGGWIEKGEVFLDVSKNVFDKQEASIMAIEHRQIAFFGLDDFASTYAVNYLDNIGESLWTKELVRGAYEASERSEDHQGMFVEKYLKDYGRNFFEKYDLLDLYPTQKERITKMEINKKETKTPRVRKDEWIGKPVDQWNEQDDADYADYQNHRRPIRFFFGKGTTEEDIDTLLDNILED